MLHRYRQLFSLHKNRRQLGRHFKEMLKQDFILQVMKQKDHYLGKNKKVIGLMKDELRKIMTEFTTYKRIAI